MTISNVKVTTQVSNKIYDLEELSGADVVRTTENSSDQSIYNHFGSATLIYTSTSDIIVGTVCFTFMSRDHLGRDRLVVGFTTTY